ncbi:unnamed protein product [Linum trigynum]|uniref:Endonuclease/exonuclease/phosphatase domain-containing protein n=1 Tax=Linum trigynum TaxID=586398 RepID=A0AAV2FCY3_9ROSI
MGYDNVKWVEARGFSGGLWALWNAGDVDLTMEASSEQILHFRVHLHTNEECLISGVYGSPNPSHRRALWETMRALSSGTSLPWLVLGDFNALLGPDDKRGGASFNMSQSREFRDCVEDCSLMDL